MLTYYSANDDLSGPSSGSGEEAAAAGGGGARGPSRLNNVAKDMLVTREDIKRWVPNKKGLRGERGLRKRVLECG